jgi:hypothetical protein
MNDPQVREIMNGLAFLYLQLARQADELASIVAELQKQTVRHR